MRKFALFFIMAVVIGTTRARQQGVGITGLLGNWTQVDDGGNALRVDGAAWNGQADTVALAATARRIFGAPAPEFVKNNSGSASFPIAVHNATDNFTGGTVRVRFKLVGGATDQYAGLMFGLKPDGSYQYVRYNTRDGNLAFWKYVNGAREVVTHGEKHVQLPLGSWQELVVTVSGNTVTGWVAGHDSVRVEGPVAAPVSGRVGLQVKRDAVTHFKGFTVRAAR